MDLTEQLKYFGLTGQEATLYLALLAQNQFTGYEAAKQTGISRSNTYTALAGLVDKGAAYVMEGRVTVYTPVPLAEFCGNRLRKLEQIRDSLLKNLPQVKTDVEGYITIKGEEEIINKLKNTINEAEARIYVSATDKAMQAIIPELQAALAKRLKVVIITAKPFELPGAIVYYSQHQGNQIRLITDSAKVLTGDLADGSSSTCLYSSKQNLVDLFKDALKNEIKLIELTGNC